MWPSNYFQKSSSPGSPYRGSAAALILQTKDWSLVSLFGDPWAACVRQDSFEVGMQDEGSLVHSLHAKRAADSQSSPNKYLWRNGSKGCAKYLRSCLLVGLHCFELDGVICTGILETLAVGRVLVTTIMTELFCRLWQAPATQDIFQKISLQQVHNEQVHEASQPKPCSSRYCIHSLRPLRSRLSCTPKQCNRHLKRSVHCPI